MRVHKPKLICSTVVSDFQTFKFVFWIYNKLPLHAAILSCESLTSSYPWSNPLKSNRSVLNENNGGLWSPKLALEENSLWIKSKGQDFASEVSSKHVFQNLKEKEKWNFWRNYLGKGTAETLVHVHAFISSKLDNCNSLL